MSNWSLFSFQRPPSSVKCVQSACHRTQRTGYTLRWTEGLLWKDPPVGCFQWIAECSSEHWLIIWYLRNYIVVRLLIFRDSNSRATNENSASVSVGGFTRNFCWKRHVPSRVCLPCEFVVVLMTVSALVLPSPIFSLSPPLPRCSHFPCHCVSVCVSGFFVKFNPAPTENLTVLSHVGVGVA